MRGAVVLWWVAAACGLMSGVPAVAEEAPAYRLVYKFAPGETVHYEVVHKMEITTQKDQATEKAVNESKSLKHYRVVSVDEDGSASLELMIDRVEMSARFGDGEPVAFNSESSEPPPQQFEEVKRSVGRPLARIKVGPDGRLISASRLYSPYGQEGQAAGAGKDEKDPSVNFLVVFPDRPLRVGDEWKDELLPVRVQVTRTLSRNVDLLRKYRLVSVEGRLATIETRSTVLSPVNDPGIRAQLIQRTPEGTIVFDMERGVIVSRRLTVNRTEVGIFEDSTGSSMRAVSERTEKLVPPPVAKKQPAADRR